MRLSLCISRYSVCSPYFAHSGRIRMRNILLREVDTHNRIPPIQAKKKTPLNIITFKNI